MKFVIQTENDVKKLQGKFVIQLDDDTPDKTLMDMNWQFAKEKRLKLVAGHKFIDLYGYVTEFGDFETFKNIFNSYLFPNMIKEGKTTGERFHRLLTARELDYLFYKIKEENY